MRSASARNAATTRATDDGDWPPSRERRQLDGGLLDRRHRRRVSRTAERRPCTPASAPDTPSSASARVDVAERRVLRDERLRAPRRRTACASTEPSAFTFISPKPGSASIRRRRSSASAPPSRRAAAFPSYSLGDELRRAPGRAAPCSREAVDRRALAEHGLEPRGIRRGDRAGVERRRAAAAASSGPENAVGTVTCWSSANPIRSASGSLAMQRVRLASSVKYSASGTSASVELTRAPRRYARRRRRS